MVKREILFTNAHDVAGGPAELQWLAALRAQHLHGRVALKSLIHDIDLNLTLVCHDIVAIYLSVVMEDDQHHEDGSRVLA